MNKSIGQTDEVCVCGGGLFGGLSYGPAICLSHLSPHSTDTQGNGDRGVGGSFWKKERGSSGLMDKYTGFGDWPKVEPIYTFICPNSPPLKSQTAFSWPSSKIQMKTG